MYQKRNEQTVHWRYYETWGTDKKKRYVQVLHTLRTKLIYKITTRENRNIKFSSLCHCNDRDYNEGKYPPRITLLERFESNLDKAFRWANSSKIYENLTDVTVD